MVKEEKFKDIYALIVGIVFLSSKRPNKLIKNFFLEYFVNKPLKQLSIKYQKVFHGLKIFRWIFARRNKISPSKVII